MCSEDLLSRVCHSQLVELTTGGEGSQEGDLRGEQGEESIRSREAWYMKGVCESVKHQLRIFRAIISPHDWSLMIKIRGGSTIEGGTGCKDAP